MKKAFFGILFAVAVFFGIATPVSAQVYGTWQYCNGGVWRFGSCGGPLVQQQQFIQQGIGVGQGVQLLAPTSGLTNGLSRCEAVGGLAGGTLGSFAKHHQAQSIILGAIAGGILGNSICSDSQGQRVLVVQQQVAQQQQGLVGQQFQQSVGIVGQNGNPCRNDPGTKEGVLYLPGNTKHGQTVCARPDDLNISRWLDGTPVIQRENTRSSRNACAHDPGTRLGILNLPDHPRHGQTVCARPGDSNISQWL